MARVTLMKTDTRDFEDVYFAFLITLRFTVFFA